MWVAIAATCVTSSMFLTALAPNLLALELVKKTANVDISWTQWFVAFAPVGHTPARPHPARHLLDLSRPK